MDTETACENYYWYLKLNLKNWTHFPEMLLLQNTVVRPSTEVPLRLSFSIHDYLRRVEAWPNTLKALCQALSCLHVVHWKNTFSFVFGLYIEYFFLTVILILLQTSKMEQCLGNNCCLSFCAFSQQASFIMIYFMSVWFQDAIQNNRTVSLRRTR